MIMPVTLMIPVLPGVDAQVHMHRSTQSLIHYFSMAPMVHLNLTVAQSKQVNKLQEINKLLECYEHENCLSSQLPVTISPSGRLLHKLFKHLQTICRILHTLPGKTKYSCMK